MPAYPRSSPGITQACQSVHIAKAILDKLAPAAKRRKLTPAALVRAMVDRIAEDNIVDAIMDDGKGA